MYELIEHKKLDVAAASITFSNIPQIYTDLVLVTSLRSNRLGPDTEDSARIELNESSASFSWRRLRGDGSSANSASGSDNLLLQNQNNTNTTANVFSNAQLHISNYRSSNSKSISVETVAENNATTAFSSILAAVWSNSSSVTSLTVRPNVGTSWLQHSSATLYGINRQQAIGKPKAIGGNITYANGYWVHTFTGSGSFYAQEDLEVDALVVAGGGGSGVYEGRYNGGGGAGGFRTLSGESIQRGSYSVLVGSGGSGAPSRGRGSKGSNSSFLSLASTGGGEAGIGSEIGSPTGGVGGSGGGGTSIGGAGGAGNQGGYSPSEGNNGGATSTGAASGGGGASAAGQGQQGSNGGAGGAGALWSGQHYSGGGGGNGFVGGVGGIGGGGNGGNDSSTNGTPGAANTGGGAGGTAINFTPGISGGSGVVIVRYRA